jgi:hypothetical protein
MYRGSKTDNSQNDKYIPEYPIDYKPDFTINNLPDGFPHLQDIISVYEGNPKIYNCNQDSVPSQILPQDSQFAFRTFAIGTQSYKCRLDVHSWVIYINIRYLKMLKLICILQEITRKLSSIIFSLQNPMLMVEVQLGKVPLINLKSLEKF